MGSYLSTNWTQFIGTYGSDSTRDFEIDSDWYIYFSGTTEGNLNGEINNFNQDAFITKLDANGNEIWTQLMDTKSSESPQDIELGNNGNIYITGSQSLDLDGKINNGGVDGFVSKLDTNGN